ncbi:MAG TPA: glutamyl-tRNA reductase [Bryobacteraceae bacterium]|jgi:glutamyl-tRNA reductase|nr:glutamyl-tRNA reductase [Bryobacteraceae bacterium]
MILLITGLNHRTAPVEVRERLAFEDGSLPDALDRLKRRPGMLEGMILSTCNRVEVAVTADDESGAEESIEHFLAESRSVAREWVVPYLYKHDGPNAIRHLFRVASSLDSMVVGEPQILGQLKTAYALAKERGTVSGFLDLVMTRAFNVAKRVRSETDIGSNAVSVSYAAVELAREIFGSLSGKRVLLVGAGKMAESAARHLKRAGVSEILVTNRTRERGEALAAEIDGKAIGYEIFLSALPTIDIVLVSSGAPHYILTREQVRGVTRQRRNRPMFLIDISVPRNIEPAVNELDNVFLYDIDDLDRVVNTNLKGRIEVAAEAEEIIREEVERMMARLRVREVTPTIVSLQDQLEQLRANEIERMRGRLGSLTPQQEEAIEAITRGIVNKIAHGPISELRKQAGDPGGVHLVDMIRKVFRLGER